MIIAVCDDAQYAMIIAYLISKFAVQYMKYFIHHLTTKLLLESNVG